jgi:GNAT superfamily N-acetyltransferase
MAIRFELRTAAGSDFDEIAELIHLSTNHWYETHGKGRIFCGDPSAARLFCEVYWALEPGCCVVAVTRTGRIVGSCFYHPRPTHVSLGIMNSHPNYAGLGVARALLAYIVEFARKDAKPLRLVSSAMNLDSFSLYNRAGLAPYAVYQDMILEAPAEGLGSQAAKTDRVRDAVLTDVPRMVALEREVHGIDRTTDFTYFVRNEAGIWHVSVLEGEGSRMDGFLVSVSHPASKMLGPGVMRTEAAAVTLITRELEVRRGQTMVWLVPSDRREIIRAMYFIGARNCELHFAQVLGEKPQVRGIVMPTFMPETG